MSQLPSLAAFACMGSFFMNASCLSTGQPRQSEDSSQLNDIGMIHPGNGQSAVIYSDKGKVYLRDCSPPISAPLTRDCVSNILMKPPLDLDEYINRLPFVTGPYERNETGLAFVTDERKNAEQAAMNGNLEARQLLPRLVEAEANLRIIVKIIADLKKEVRDVTYRSYDVEFGKLLTPFAPAPPPAPPEVNYSCRVLCVHHYWPSPPITTRERDFGWTNCTVKASSTDSAQLRVAFHCSDECKRAFPTCGVHPFLDCEATYKSKHKHECTRQ